jgi:NAD dependent epimerase/dehydratase
MSNSKPTVFLTGADGFIGSHLCELLINSGEFQVKALANYNSLNSWGWLDTSDVIGSKDLQVVSGDIRDHSFVLESMKGVDFVLHLAALIAIPHSYTSPESYVQTNVLGTLNVLQAAKNCEVKRFIHTSTSETYGTAQTVPISEDHPLTAQSPYAASKIAADKLVESFHLSFDFPAITVRPFNTYGPRQSARAIIPTVISQIASGKRQIRIGSSTPTRDFSFVADTVSGFQTILKSNIGLGETFNLGTGFEISINDLIFLISEIMGVEIEIVCDDSRVRPEKSEVERLLADTSKVQREFDWKPEFFGLDGLRSGLERTIDWFRNPENLLKYKTEVYNT